MYVFGLKLKQRFKSLMIIF